MTIIPTGNYFDASVWCSFHVVSAQKVVCPKENQGAQGSPNFSCYQLAATAALPDLFGVVVRLGQVYLAIGYC